MIHLYFEILSAFCMIYGIFLIIKFFFDIEVDIKGVTFTSKNYKEKKDNELK